MAKRIVYTTIDLFDVTVELTVECEYIASRPAIIRADPMDSHPEDPGEFEVLNVVDETGAMDFFWLYQRSTTFKQLIDNKCLALLVES